MRLSEERQSRTSPTTSLVCACVLTRRLLVVGVPILSERGSMGPGPLCTGLVPVCAGSVRITTSDVVTVAVVSICSLFGSSRLRCCPRFLREERSCHSESEALMRERPPRHKDLNPLEPKAAAARKWVNTGDALVRYSPPTLSLDAAAVDATFTVRVLLQVAGLCRHAIYKI